ncbi:MAG TPA: hypothetical protein VFG01_02865 [Acidobacteriota bacterium]|nr:hypothetical protein [Acidobacteriota bacterium]
MAKSSENTKVLKKDLDFIQEKLSKQNNVPTLGELTESLAYKKNARQLNQEVLKYDSECTYEVNDLICKKYDEPLVISSKEKKHFQDRVVLKVTNKIKYPDFNCEMLEVDYTGGGIFRKHIDYMKRKNTQVLLPSAQGKCRTPEAIKKEDDPRLHRLPMTEKDMKTLSVNLRKSISKSDEFFGWNKHWQLTKKKIEILDDKIEKIEKLFREKKQSASTEKLIEKFFNIKPEDDKFDIYCLSLNHILSKKYKKTFVCVSTDKWGKWFLKEILDSFLKDLPLSAEKAELPHLEEETYEPVKTKEQKFPLKIYLSWREVLSGGIKMPSALKKELSDTREYVFTDEEEDKDFTTFYYPDLNIFLGLDEFYKKYFIPQGASLTLKKKDSNHISFRLKKSKKKLTLPYLEYNAKKDEFSISENEISTYALPNKIIFIEHESLKNLLKLSEQIKKEDLRELLIIVFKNFGFEGERQTLHYRKAFHLVDTLKHTSLEEIEKTLCLSPEFAMSEKKKGLFFYHEKIKTEKDLEFEEPSKTEEELKAEEKILEAQEEALPEIGTVGEISTPEIHLEERKEIKPPKKKKPAKKKEKKKPKPKPKPPPREEEEIVVEEPPLEKRQRKTEKKEVEFAKPARSKKGKKRIIEEQIEQEESELEAFFAVKTDKEKEIEEEGIEHLKPKPEEKKEFKKPEQKEPLAGGLFGEKLKSALNKKKDEEPEKKKKLDKKNKK